MKTEIELLGFEVEVEEVDGMLSVKVMFGEETVEELTLDPSEYGASSEGEEELPEGEEDVMSFDDFDGEGESDTEVDVETEVEVDEDGVEEEDVDVEETFESFSSFMKK